ncbi:MAG: ferrous iron transport protein A [Acidobacteria bacterium]|nr:ferrous iron transport protein A [Acidobacteriota bacterium]
MSRYLFCPRERMSGSNGNGNGDYAQQSGETHPLRLTYLPLETPARVARIDAAGESLVLNFGIYPGVSVQVRQRYPCYVIKCEETEVALEGRLASQIWVYYPHA